jgi:hypothetical protein
MNSIDTRIPEQFGGGFRGAFGIDRTLFREPAAWVGAVSRATRALLRPGGYPPTKCTDRRLIRPDETYAARLYNHRWIPNE